MPARKAGIFVESAKKEDRDSWLRNRVKRPLTFAIHYPTPKH
jgi:hypothetical protein